MTVTIEFIRHQVEPELVDDHTKMPTQYGPPQTHAYKPGFCGMPLTWGNDYPPAEDIDGGRVALIGA